VEQAPGKRKREMKVHDLPIEQVVIGERFRKDMGDLEGLTNSVKEKGILQPITVDTEYMLIAGGRRIEAAKLAGLTHIPAIIRKTVDELDLREVELYENIHRKDMQWWERAHLEKKIFDLHIEKDPQ